MMGQMKTGLVLLAMLLGLTACGHEVINVPPRSSMLGRVPLNQTYDLRQKTEMDIVGETDAQPKVSLFYWKSEGLPAEGFERVLFSVETSGDSAGYSTISLSAGTPVLFALAEIYQNCHIYIGRILGGDAANVHVLLVVPVGSARMPTTRGLQDADKGYLVPEDNASTRPVNAVK
jgi:hypothetical protein